MVRPKITALLAVALIASVLAATPPAPAGAQTTGATTPIHPDNRPSPIADAANGRLPGDLLRHVTPSCLVYAPAAPSLIQLLRDAAADGIRLVPDDCYRDYEGQVAMRKLWCDRGACHMAAVPGTSNHGWAKAVDFGDGRSSLTWTSPAYRWLKDNAGRYGWNHAAVFWPTGSVPEPWHWEWVGDGGRMFPGMTYGIGDGVGLPGTGSPGGSLDTAVEATSAPSPAVRLTGWAADGNTTAPIDVHVYLDGRFAGQARADTPRADVARVLHGYAASPHGFDLVVPSPLGTHTVCAYGINVGPGTNALLGCRTVTVGRNPFGHVDAASPGMTGGVVSGWAIDPDQLGSIDVHVYVNGVLRATGRAGRSRTDVQGVWPMHGGANGFELSYALGHGTNEVCVYGINVGPGTNTLIGCRRVVADRHPVGHIDSVTAAAGAVTVTGWALDPDTAQPIAVHVYVGGRGVPVTASGQRPDLARVFPPYGPAHGFTATVRGLPAGVHPVCVYAINVGPGTTNPLIGGTCRTVRV